MGPAEYGRPKPARRCQATACVALTVWFALCLLIPATTRAQVTIGSKKFTESVILGEIAAQAIEARGIAVHHRKELGGTRFLWNALLAGEIDAYPEYTGTIIQEILGGEERNLEASLREKGIGITNPLGFNNTYALGMMKERAASMGVKAISGLANHPHIVLAFSNEFMDRPDGWPGLQAHYGLSHRNVRGIDHDLAYRGLEAGSIDVMDLYSTDAEIDYYDLTILEDDLHFFPEYDAVYLYRLDLEEQAVETLRRLEGKLPADEMIAMNARAKIDRQPESAVAGQYLGETFGIRTTARETSRSQRVWLRTKEHLTLVAISLLAAILLAIPLGIAAARYERLGQFILGFVGVIYTIPSLALLVFMIPLLGIGGPPAIVALFLYSLLPIVRNTHAGLKNIPHHLAESADALGLRSSSKLRLVELPLASRSILAGIQTSAVINIGTATLGALIGAGGYGQPILTGIRLDDVSLILEGAVPAALLALIAQLFFELAGWLIVPKGLRLASA